MSTMDVAVEKLPGGWFSDQVEHVDLPIPNWLSDRSLCANMCETSSPSTITVGREKKSHLGQSPSPSASITSFVQ